jgi:hypothetical protein
LLSPFKLLFEGVCFLNNSRFAGSRKIWLLSLGYCLFAICQSSLKLLYFPRQFTTKEAAHMAGKLLKFLLAIILVSLGVWTIFLWWADLLVLLRGGIGLLLILAGIIAFAIALD